MIVTRFVLCRRHWKSKFQAKISRAKSENEFNKLQSRFLSSEECNESEKSDVFDSSEEDSINSRTDIFLRPPFCGVSNATRIRINGGKVARQHQFPWMVALGYVKSSSSSEITWACAGALITEKHVLTAAHCIYETEQYLKMVRVGASDILNDYTYKHYDPGQDILIDKKIPHEKYERKNFIHDIGMVTLKRKSVAPMVWPICLPASCTISRRNYVGETVTVAGWGIKYYKGPRNPLLEFVTLKVYPKEKCTKKVSYLKHRHNVMCAADPQWKQSLCSGDSGGPMMYQVTETDTIYYAIGLVSFGSRYCDTPGKFIGFTEIAPYLDWIRNQILKK